jgi:hypothetical protein
MAPLSNVLTVALLVLGGVDAKRKDKISFSQYSENDCNGHPLSGKLNDLQLIGRASECTPVGSQGVRIHKHKKNKYSKWIDDVNTGRDQCGATLFRGYGCARENILDNISLPADFNECNPLPKEAISIQFWCRKNSGYEGIAEAREVEMPVTSYSIAPDGKAHPSVYTTFFNATQYIYNPVEEFTGLDQVTVTVPDVDEVTTTVDAVAQIEQVKVTAPKVNARAEPTHKAALEPRRKKHNVVGVWMKHPWTNADICFKCWTKKEWNYGKFDCRSGHFNKYYIDCGPKPAPVPPTSTVDITRTRTVEFWTTEAAQYSFPLLPTASTVQFSFPHVATASPEKRSPHMAVVLHSPWFPNDKICADAEWENAGKPKAEVRIQDTKAFHKCGRNVMNIDIGIPEQTRTRWDSVTASDTHTTRPAYAQPTTVTTTNTFLIHPPQ